MRMYQGRPDLIIKNGASVIEHGCHTGARAGRVLRHKPVK